MSKAKGSREPADRQTRLSIAFWPWSTHTIAYLTLGWRDNGGAHSSPLAYWHLDVGRADLQGRPTNDVLRILVNGLVRHLDEPDDPADQVAQAADIRTAEGPAAPLGATGGTVTQDSPPGI